MAGYSTTFARASTQYLTKSTPTGLVTGNGSRTVFGWVKFTTLPSSGQNYFLTDYTNGGTRGFAPFVTNSAGVYKFALSDYVASNPTTISITTGVWYFWAVTHDGTNTKLYWNGSLINTTARTLVMASAPTTLRVATAANNTTDLTNGQLFGVGYTSDAKTKEQLDVIQTLMGSQINSTNISNLISVFCVTNNFNDVTGTNNMTAVNSPSQTTDIPVADVSTSTGFKQATINASLVPSTQTNFPAYVDISRLGIANIVEARSVRVYADSAKTTEWAREIVSATEMHVKVPSLTSTVTMYVDYDGVRADYAVTDTYGRNAVWSGYRAVLHMQSSGTDSTGIHTNTDTAISYTAQQLGQGGDFEASSASRVHLGNVATGFTTFPKWSAWLLPESPIKNGMIWAKTNVVSPATDNFYIYLVRASDTTAYLNVFVGNGATNVYFDSSTFTFTSRKKLDVVYDTTTRQFKIYLDAVLLSTSGVLSVSAINNATSNFYFGDWHLVSGSTYQFDGTLDEGRCSGGSSTMQSADWITTEYNNQSNESSFWGTWSDVGGATPSRNLMMMGVGM